MEKQISEILMHAAETDKGIWFIQPDAGEQFQSYRSLKAESLKMLGAMQKNGIPRGSCIVFQLSDNRSFLISFWCCMLGGYLPVPIPVCIDAEKRSKMVNVLSVLDMPCVLADDAVQPVISETLAAHPHLQSVPVLNAGEMMNSAEDGIPCAADASQTAMIQFSSGSTGQPKGVQLTHRNVIANIHSIAGAAAFGADDSVLSWLPLTHDMGLIGAHMTPLLLHMNQYIMQTELFLRRPVLWFDKITEHRVTVTLAPNFAYKMMLSVLKCGMHFQWDLSSLRFIMNGAEPISADVCNRFIAEMAAFGLKEETILNVYGMAEASLAVAFSAPNEKIVFTEFDRRCLSIGDRVRRAEDKAQSFVLVDVGTAVPNCAIRIADAADCVQEEGVIGEIQLNGPNITCGYYKNEAANAALFTADGWLHTGDVGFFFEGKLYISGRFKEILFLNGQNYYPYDIEDAIEKLMALPTGSVAVCGVPDPKAGRDRVYVFAERIESEDAERFAAELRMKLMEHMKLHIDAVVPVERLPRTASGKIQRVLLKNKAAEQIAADAAQTKMPEADQAPMNETEKLLIGFCQECLSEEGEIRIGRDDSFMELGFDSVRLMTLAERIGRQFRRKLDVTVLFANPTVRALAAYLDGQKTVTMPEISFSQHSDESDSAAGCVSFSVSGDKLISSDRLTAFFADTIKQVSGEKQYSFHCMCSRPGDIERYSYDSGRLEKCETLKVSDLITAKCSSRNTCTCILFDGELNRSHYNMLHDYDIAVEYRMEEHQTRFYCYYTSGAEKPLIRKIADTIASGLNKTC